MNFSGSLGTLRLVTEAHNILSRVFHIKINNNSNMNQSINDE